MAGFERVNRHFDARSRRETDLLVGRGGGGATGTVVQHPGYSGERVWNPREEYAPASWRARARARSASVLSAAAILLGIDQLPGSCATGRQFQA